MFKTTSSNHFHSYINIPNPFNPTTTIDYYAQQGGIVEIKIFNVKGELIKTLVSEHKQPGNYSTVWDGKNNRVDFPRFCRHLKVMVRGAFKRLGTYSADMAMPTLRIIKQLDVIKQVCSCFFSGRIDPSAYSLHF